MRSLSSIDILLRERGLGGNPNREVPVHDDVTLGNGVESLCRSLIFP